MGDGAECPGLSLPAGKPLLARKPLLAEELLPAGSDVEMSVVGL